MDDCLIVGGGVIGLSLAYELSGAGLRVRVLDRAEPGHEASWAGAGMLPPGNRHSTTDPLQRLAGLSHELHPVWSAMLREETGIDNGYVRCGAIYLARDADRVARLRQDALTLSAEQIPHEELSVARLALLEPALIAGLEGNSTWGAYLVPDEGQIRNPRHLKALLAGCRSRGVQIEAGQPVEGLTTSGQRVTSVRTPAGSRSAETICLTAGSWSRSLLESLGHPGLVRPIRGQIVLLSAPQRPLRRIVNEGPRYLVPRADGRVLVGSTEEDVGYDKRTTASGVEELLGLARSLVPALATAEVERTWAGLRPGTRDTRPYLGRVPELENVFVATGHFRSGLQLSPATAVVLSRLIRGEAPGVDLAPFSLARD